MKAYYHARALEYDNFWLGRGEVTGLDQSDAMLEGARGRVLHDGRWFVAVAA